MRSIALALAIFCNACAAECYDPAGSRVELAGKIIDQVQVTYDGTQDKWVFETDEEVCVDGIGQVRKFILFSPGEKEMKIGGHYKIYGTAEKLNSDFFDVNPKGTAKMVLDFLSWEVL